MATRAELFQLFSRMISFLFAGARVVLYDTFSVLDHHRILTKVLGGSYLAQTVHAPYILLHDDSPADSLHLHG
ncbi:hypothetical protein ACP4OV_021842 [Aristida adscensionis]